MGGRTWAERVGGAENGINGRGLDCRILKARVGWQNIKIEDGIASHWRRGWVEDREKFFLEFN